MKTNNNITWNTDVNPALADGCSAVAQKCFNTICFLLNKEVGYRVACGDTEFALALRRNFFKGMSISAQREVCHLIWEEGYILTSCCLRWSPLARDYRYNYLIVPRSRYKGVEEGQNIYFVDDDAAKNRGETADEWWQNYHLPNNIHFIK